MNSIIEYFDLRSAQRTVIAEGQDGGTKPASVIWQYVFLVLGVVAEPFIRTYAATDSFDGSTASFGARVLFGSLIGIALLPAVYKTSFDPSKPPLIQLFALFPIGIGWQSLFTSAANAVT